MTCPDVARAAAAAPTIATLAVRMRAPLKRHFDEYSQMEPGGETTYRGGNQTFEQLEDPCGGLISWSAEAVT
jgi:hypothetical protein